MARSEVSDKTKLRMTNEQKRKKNERKKEKINTPKHMNIECLADGQLIDWLDIIEDHVY